MRKKRNRLFAAAALVIFSMVLLIISIRAEKAPGILQEIKNGRFYLLNNEKIEKQLNRLFSSEPAGAAWIWQDMNGDGVLDLILTEKNPPERIIGVFALRDNIASVILWDDVEMTEYYKLCETGLLYYSQYYGVYDKERYALYHYDGDWKKELIKGLEVDWREDIDTEAEWESFPYFAKEKRSCYFAFYEKEGQERQEELTRETWLNEYELLFGTAYPGDR